MVVEPDSWNWPEEPMDDARERPCSPNGFGLCTTHPVCDYMRAGVQEFHREIAGLKAELRARAQLLDALVRNIGEEGNSWGHAADIDWRRRLRDFAEDREQHQVSHAAWKQLRGHGVTLYAWGGFYTAYYDDAAALWEQADDTRPMFHVMVQSDRPHRTVIHALHLHVCVEHFAEIHLPVQVVGAGMLEE